VRVLLHPFANGARGAGLLRHSIPIWGARGRFGSMDGAISESFWSNVGRSGAGSEVSFALRSSRGRSLERVSWLICRRGRAGPGDCWNCTILGRDGSIFGGSRGSGRIDQRLAGMVGVDGIGEDALTRVKGVAPSGAKGLSGSPRGIGLAFGAFLSTKGKSVMGRTR